MTASLSLEKKDKTPIYRQIHGQLAEAIRDGSLKAGQMLPSMNEMADHFGISRESVKKAYSLLCKDNLVVPRQGKGFFVADNPGNRQPDILVILDKQSIYKQTLLQSFQDKIGGKAHLTILVHNQNLDVFEYYLNTHLDNFDFYVISPHFDLDKESQARAVRLMKRIPNRKLIMVDHWLKGVSGNYGVVYQDFENDAYLGLSAAADDLVRCGHLRVVIMPNSMYGSIVLSSVKAFASERGIKLSVSRSVPDTFEKGDIILMLNSQLDYGLTLISRNIRKSGLSVGGDIRLISYNEFSLNEIIMGGLTTISTDFEKMGSLAAEMVLSGKMSKIHNDFRMTRRHTF